MPFVMDKFKSKNRASVSEEFALFNWSCRSTIADVKKGTHKIK